MPKIKDIEVTLWGPGYVGELPEVARWFKKHQIIPPIGSAVSLPRQLNVAKSGESVDIEFDEDEGLGTITSIYFATDFDKVFLGVTPGSVDTETKKAVVEKALAKKNQTS